jgi:hypothetical protein
MRALAWRVLAAPRQWCETPLPVAVLGLLACLLAGVVQVAAALGRAETVRREVASELASLAANAAALEIGVARPGRHTLAVGEHRVVVEVGGRVVACAVRSGDGEVAHFVAPVLPGALPMALAHRFASVDPRAVAAVGDGVVVAPEDLPRLAADALAAAPRADRWPGFRRDPAVALMRLEGGTERDDHVVAVPDGAALPVPPAGVVVVPGHLWLTSPSGVLRVGLERDLVVVVEGNLYVAASLVVDGPGRLVLWGRTPPGQTAFADNDGNGRFTAGDRLLGAGGFAGALEGAGGVYFGLPGGSPDLAIGALLVAEGELHAVARTTLHAPAVAKSGLTELGSGSIRCGESELLDVQRDSLPGLLPSGQPRPGRLLAMAPLPAGSAAGVPEELLYLGVPGR